MATLAEIFNDMVSPDICLMIEAVKQAGGGMWGDEKSWIVEFNDGSYWSAAIFEPQDSDPYYNGSAKTNP